MTEGRANHEKANITGKSFQYTPRVIAVTTNPDPYTKEGWSQCILWDQRTKYVYSQWYSAVNSQNPEISI